MALSFNNQKGSAQKSSAKIYKYEDNNQFRLVGDILPRYVYWVKGENGKSIPMECLAFDRASESFTNKQKDWVREFYPDLNCSWAYCAQIIDPADGEVKVINLKKKMWEQINTAAEDLGDPTDYDTGWDVIVKRTKTGPLAYNVEYTVQVLKCKSRPLTEKERAAVADLQSMEVVMPVPTPEAQKAFLEKLNSAATESSDQEAEDEFDIK